MSFSKIFNKLHSTTWSPSKVFIGLRYPARIAALRVGFKKLGIPVITATIGESHHPDIDVEITGGAIDMNSFSSPVYGATAHQIYLQHAFQSLYDTVSKECDLIIFLGRSFADDCSDFLAFKNAGKKVAVHLTPEDALWFPAVKQEASIRNSPPPFPVIESSSADRVIQVLRWLRMAELSSDLITGWPDCMQLAVRPYGLVPNLEIPETSVSAPPGSIRIGIPPLDPELPWVKRLLTEFQAFKSNGLEISVQVIPVGLPAAELAKLGLSLFIGDLAVEFGRQFDYAALSAGIPTALNLPASQTAVVMDGIVRAHPDDMQNLIDTIREIPSKIDLLRSQAIKSAESLAPEILARRIIQQLNGSTSGMKSPNFFKDHYKPVYPEEQQIQNSFDPVLKMQPWFPKA